MEQAVKMQLLLCVTIHIVVDCWPFQDYCCPKFIRQGCFELIRHKSGQNCSGYFLDMLTSLELVVSVGGKFLKTADLMKYLDFEFEYSR